MEKGVLTTEEIKRLLGPIAEKYGISRLYLYGSYARNEAGPQSDVDLLMEGGCYEGLTGYLGILEEMKAVLGKKVDLLTQAALYESDSKLMQGMREKFEKEAVSIYDAEEGSRKQN